MLETYHDKQHKIVIDSSANELKVPRETDYQFLKRQEEILKQMRDDLDEISKMSSSEHFERKIQA